MTVNELIVKNELLNAGFTKEAAAAVMGVVGGETNFLTFKESSYKNTDNNRIRGIFGRLKNMSDADLNKLKADDEAFFNKVYGGLYGNADNEGWRYVGRGFNGITFKSNYALVAAGTGIDFVNNPELLEKAEYAAKALAYYFRTVKLLSDFETAFQEAYRQNAGVGKSFDFYAKSRNPVHVEGMKRKRELSLGYLRLLL